MTRAVKRGGLYVTDAELIEKLGVPEKIAREAIAAMDKNPRSGFPRKLALFGNRRHWPSVENYLASNYSGLSLTGLPARSASHG